MTVYKEEVKGRLTAPLVLAVAAATLGSSFIFGYNIGVINSPDKVIKTWIQNDSAVAMHGRPLTDGQLQQIWSWIVAVYPLSGMFGGLACGWMADRFGRKGAMMLNNIFTITAALLMGISKFSYCYPLLIIGRLIVGFNCGLNSGLAPMYLVEIAPPNLSGMLGSVCQLMVTVSILVANVLGMPQVLGTEKMWPLLLALTAVPSVWQLIALRFCPETPKFLLLVKKKEDDAINALRRLRGKSDVSAEMATILEEAEMSALQAKSLTLTDMFRSPVLAWSLTIATVMMIAQQFSGINAVMYYSTTIFRDGAQLTQEQAAIGTLGMTGINVCMTVVSTLIVDRAGRRVLMLMGLAGMWICGMCIVIALHLLTVDKESYQMAGYVAIFFVILFVVSFAAGPGSIPWFYVSELFDQSARGYANTIAVATNWGVNFIVGYTYLAWSDLVHEFSFLLYVGFVSVSFLFIYAFAPETKGRRLADITNELEKQSHKVIQFFTCGRRQYIRKQ